MVVSAGPGSASARMSDRTAAETARWRTDPESTPKRCNDRRKNSRSAWEVVRPGRYSGFRPAIDCIDRKHDELAAGDFINSRLQLLLKLTWRPTRPDRGWRRGLEVWIAGSRHGSIMP